jgi:beta-lactamase superfamily II metal-dependent hydrolase
MLRSRSQLVIAIAVFVLPALAPGQKAWNGSVDGLWGRDANWSPAGIPVASDDVVIGAAPNAPSVFDAAAFCHALTIEAGGTLQLSSSHPLTVGGHWTNGGTFSHGSATVVLDGTAAVQGGSPTAFHDLTIASGQRSAAAAFSIEGALVVDAGATLLVGASTVTLPTGSVTAPGTISVGAGGTLALGPAVTALVPPGGTLSLVGAPGSPATVAGVNGGGYALTVGGTIAARHFAFSGMGAAGVVVGAAATIAPSPHDFQAGTFDHAAAAAGSVLLDITRSAPTELRYLALLASSSTGTFGVRCTDGAAITFVNWSGALGGPAVEDDPGGRLHWTTQATQVASFLATPGCTDVELHWTTTAEVDVDRFLVERGLTAAGPFTQVAETVPVGPSTYAFVDLALPQGTQFHYRLSERILIGAVNQLGALDIATGTEQTFYADADGDGYGNAAVTQLACTVPLGYVTDATDCDDGNQAVNPAANEVCNGIDDDCDGLTDDADPGVLGQTLWYADADGDGYGNAAVTQLACTAPSGFVANATDCDDGNQAVNPGATEICNGIDDDCDTVIDPGCQPPPDLRIHHIPVEHGDATLIVGPTGITCLIDAGFIGSGTNVVAPFLNQLGITALDYTVVTHHHDDHYGGVSELVTAGFLPVVAAYDRGVVNQPTGSFFFNQYLAAIAGKRTSMSVGTVIDLGPGATLQCVAANGVALGGASVAVAGTSGEENARSLALLLKYGEYEEAICGDLTGGLGGTPNVQAIVGPVLGDVDVYKVCHHGSSTSSAPAFVGALSPEVCTISPGTLVSALPHQGTLDLLLGQPTCAAVYRLTQGSTAVGGTVVDGALLVTTNGSTYTCSGGSITPLTRAVDETFGVPPQTHSPGDVVVSEFLADPQAVSDAAGEWIELRNTRPYAINLHGFSLQDAGTNFLVFPPLSLPAFGHLVTAANGNPLQNGGFLASHVWPSGAMALGNSTDLIELVSPQGVIVDSVAYAPPGSQPPPGSSLERIDATAPAWAANFAVATATFGAGDHGTPGTLNSHDHTPPFGTLTASGPMTLGSVVVLLLSVPGAPSIPCQMALSHAQAPPIVLPADGRPVPLAYGLVLEFSLQPGNGITSAFSGVLGPTGEASGEIFIPPEPFLSGLTIWAGAVLIDPAYPGGIGSIPHSIAITIM